MCGELKVIVEEEYEVSIVIFYQESAEQDDRNTVLYSALWRYLTSGARSSYLNSACMESENWSRKL